MGLVDHLTHSFMQLLRIWATPVRASWIYPLVNRPWNKFLHQSCIMSLLNCYC